MAVRVTYLAEGIFTVILSDIELGQLQAIKVAELHNFSSTTLKQIIVGGLSLLYDTHCRKESEAFNGARVS